MIIIHLIDQFRSEFAKLFIMKMLCDFIVKRVLRTSNFKLIDKSKIQILVVVSTACLYIYNYNIICSNIENRTV